MVSIEVWPLKSKNYKKNNVVFHTKTEAHVGISPTARLRAVPYFIKTDNTVKWGKKWFSKLALIICLMINHKLCTLSPIKSHIQKRKSEAIGVLRVQKWAFYTQKLFWDHIFDPYGHKWPQILVFVWIFFDQWKKAKYLIHHTTYNLCQFVKLKYFYPFLEYEILFHAKTGGRWKNWCRFRL